MTTMKCMMTRWVLGSLAISLFAGAALYAEAEAKSAPPIRVLLITGGRPDYRDRLKILTDGISARANVVWTLDGEAGEARDVKLSRYKREDWAKPFDVVVYSMYSPEVTDVAYVEGIAKAHQEKGVPAVFLSDAIQGYRAETDAWFSLCGVTSRRLGERCSFEIETLKPDHPIMKGFPDKSKPLKGELYSIEKVWPTAVPLAQAISHDANRPEVCIWTNQVGKARVFGTSVGHDNETMAESVYLDLVARGLLWATDKLDNDGKPRPGYGSIEGTWFSLFDGQTFDGWKFSENKQSWKIEDGEIVAHGPRSHLFYEGQVGNADFKNFELRCEVYTYPKANAGIFFHTKYQDTGWPRYGHEAQINATHRDPRKTGSLYIAQDVMNDAPHKDLEWFDYHIMVRGQQVIFKVNGKTVMEYTEPAEVEGTRRLSRGAIALQAHDPGSQVHFRNLCIRLLPD